LKGAGIPLSARIVALADVYDALTDERPYKAAFTHEVALNLICEEEGKHFDPDMVRAFLVVAPALKQGKTELL
jgi:putative two-component system response regulator